MTLKHLSYQKTGYFSELMIDYLAEKEDLLPFFGRFPSIENFEELDPVKSLFCHTLQDLIFEIDHFL